jgi:hypothetical protein
VCIAAMAAFKRVIPPAVGSEALVAIAAISVGLALVSALPRRYT